MILIDTSIWIDHFKITDATVYRLLSDDSVLIHPWIIGELAVGTYHDRAAILGRLKRLNEVVVATDAEVMKFIESNKLFGVGIGFIDAALLASIKLTAGAAIWTRDRRLQAAADNLSIMSMPLS